VTKRILKYTLLPAAVIAMAACSGKNKADVAQKANEIANNSAQCPKAFSQEAGTYAYNAKGTKSTYYIKISNDKKAKLLTLDLAGNETYKVDGKPVQNKNGSNASASCVNDTIRVVGKTKAKQERSMTISLIDKNDYKKGIKVSQKGVADVTYEYSPNKGVITDPLTPSMSDKEAALPRSEDLEDQPSLNQQPPAPQPPAAPAPAPAKP
jgi:hypothetical protein